MIFYANRHKDGAWLPHLSAKRGFTHTGATTLVPPRLFPTRRHAAKALTAWLKGHANVGTVSEGDWETGYYSVQGGVEYTPVPDRIKEDWATVEVEVIFK